MAALQMHIVTLVSMEFILAHAFMGHFLSEFNYYILENQHYEAVSFAMTEDNDFVTELAKSTAEKLPVAPSSSQNYKVLSFMDFDEAGKRCQKHPSARVDGQFIKDPNTTLFLFSTSDLKRYLTNITFYFELRSRFSMQPIMFLMFRNSKAIYEVHELQTFSQKAIKVAEWDESQKAINYLNVEPLDRRENLSGVILKSSNEGELPFFAFGDEKGEYLGITGSILTLFKKKFQFDIEWSNITSYGTLDENGSWTGIVQGLMENKLDFSGVEMTQSDERKEVVDFGFSLMKSESFLWFHNSKESGTHWLALLDVFTGEFWLVVASTMVIFFLLLQLINNAAYRAKDCSASAYSVLSLVFVVKSFVGQSQDEGKLFLRGDKNRQTSVSILTFGLSLCGALVFLAYSSCLTSLLAVQSSSPPFSSLRELKRLSNFKLMVYSSGSTISTIRTQILADEDLMLIYKRNIEPHLMKDTGKKNLLDYIAAKDPHSSILLEALPFYKSAKLANVDACNFHKVQFRDVKPSSNGWLYPRNSLLHPLFDKFMLELTERGIVRQILEANNPRQFCSDAQQFKEIDMDFVKVIFVLLAGGIVISLFTFLFEKCCSRRT